MRLVKLALVVGGIALAAKLVTAKKSEWMGLTESEIREKLDSRLGNRVSDEKRAAIADKIASAMRERGMLREEAGPPADSGGARDEPDSDDANAGDDSENSTKSA